MGKPVVFVQFQRDRLLGLLCELGKGGWRARKAVEACASGEEGAEAWGRAVGELRGALSSRVRGALPCVVVPHRADYAVLRAELPPGTALETESMLELELGEALPLDGAEVCCGWRVVGRTAEGRRDGSIP